MQREKVVGCGCCGCCGCCGLLWLLRLLWVVIVGFTHHSSLITFPFTGPLTGFGFAVDEGDMPYGFFKDEKQLRFLKLKH
jgi:hypothetical protein